MNTAPQLWQATAADADWVNDTLFHAFAKYTAIMNAHRETPRLRSDRAWIPARIAAGDVWLFGPASDPKVVAVLGPDPGLCTIDLIGVHPDLQGQGWGHGMLQALEDKARRAGATAMAIYTGQPMTDLVAFYSRHGFLVSSVGPNMQDDDGVPRVFMKKPL